MKAADFRLGNYLQATGRGGIKIPKPIDSHLMQVMMALAPAEQIHGEKVFLNFTWQPIPLTKEWVVDRFGFQQQAGEFDNCYDKGAISINCDGGYWFPIIYQSRDIGVDTIGQEIKHVHQLQNLYFALTGEELEIKPHA